MPASRPPPRDSVRRLEDPPVRVLLIDDEPALREALATVVARTPGFVIVGESADGESALLLAEQLAPDMVLLDVRMAPMDGFETARRLHAQGGEEVIVLLTASDVREFAPLARTSSVAALVQKQWLNASLLRGLWVAHRRR